MLDKELFVCGVSDKSGYRCLWHIGEYEQVRKTYDASISGAQSSGLNKDAIFLFPFPPDDEVVEKFKLTMEFLKWLKEESQVALQASN